MMATISLVVVLRACNGEQSRVNMWNFASRGRRRDRQGANQHRRELSDAKCTAETLLLWKHDPVSLTNLTTVQFAVRIAPAHTHTQCTAVSHTTHGVLHSHHNHPPHTHKHLSHSHSRPHRSCRSRCRAHSGHSAHHNPSPPHTHRAVLPDTCTHTLCTVPDVAHTDTALQNPSPTH